MYRASRPKFGAALLVLAVAGCSLAGGGSEGEVRSLLAATERKDHRAIVESFALYSLQAEQLKASLPKSQWERAIDDHYRKKADALAKAPDFWQGYGENLTAMMGDPVTDIRMLLSLLPPGAKWRITETRPVEGVNLNAGTPTKLAKVFVTIDYANASTAPRGSAGSALAQAMLEFTVDVDSGLITSLRRVASGEVPRG
jgi:hypothetical protein